MSNFAIRLENLGKQYKIGARQERYYTLRDSIAQGFGRLFRRHPQDNQPEDHIWALKDVSLEIKHGEVVGIIGRNGAGKTTLLKILSRITEPTTGRAEIHGRIGSLLEVGTGFHPELTGRENIYLNAAILGMKRAEIDRKFDEIVAFAEVEKFLDTPVKRYSSGMYVRLAFAVAAHLDPEILLVDEVLAVGDAAFQKKCLGKMSDVAQEGRTVLFVSHNMGAVRDLCSIVNFFDQGALLKTGYPTDIISYYLNFNELGQSQSLISVDEKDFKLLDIIINQDGTNNNILSTQRPFKIYILYKLKNRINNLLLGFDIYSNDGQHIFRTYDLEAIGLADRDPGVYVSECSFPANIFQNTSYFAELIVGVHRARWISKKQLRLKLTFEGPRSTDVDYLGMIKPIAVWSVKKKDGCITNLLFGRFPGTNL